MLGPWETGCDKLTGNGRAENPPWPQVVGRRKPFIGRLKHSLAISASDGPLGGIYSELVLRTRSRRSQEIAGSYSRNSSAYIYRQQRESMEVLSQSEIRRPNYGHG